MKTRVKVTPIYQWGKREDLVKIPTKVLVKANRQRVFVDDANTLMPADPVVFIYEYKQYKVTRAMLKQILDTREHIPNKLERKRARQQKAKNGN